MNRPVLVTGRPGIGKSTVIMKTIDLLRRQGLVAGGMVTKEARQGELRSGFRIIDLITGQEGWLALVGANKGIRFGRYMVCPEDLEHLGVRAITNALADRNVSVVIVDEIGPMELTSERFREAIRTCQESTKMLLATIHYSSKDPLLSQLRRTPGAEIVVVTLENRDSLPQSLSHIIANDIRGQMVLR